MHGGTADAINKEALVAEVPRFTCFCTRKLWASRGVAGSHYGVDWLLLGKVQNFPCDT